MKPKGAGGVNRRMILAVMLAGAITAFPAMSLWRKAEASTASETAKHAGASVKAASVPMADRPAPKDASVPKKPTSNAAAPTKEANVIPSAFPVPAAMYEAGETFSVFELPWSVTGDETSGLYANEARLRQVPSAIVRNFTGAPVAVDVTTRHCTLLSPSDQRARVLWLELWEDHAQAFGCTVPPTLIRLLPPLDARDRDSAVVNQLVVSLSAPTDGGVTCVVDFVAGVSTDARTCSKYSKASNVPPFPNGTNWERFCGMRKPPYRTKLAPGHPLVQYVSVELTAYGTVLPFIAPPGVPPHQLPPFSLLPRMPETKIVSGPPAELRAKLDAPMRCDQGLYMGFTNIIESLVACVVFAVAGRRNHVEFPSRFQQESFLTLFDAERLRSKALEWYGVHVSFLDRGQSVLTPKEFHSVLPKLAKDFPAFRRVTGARPGARVFTGDVWVTRLTSISESHQTRWFKGAAYVPAGKLRVMSERLIDEIRSLSVKAGAASRSAAQKGISNSGGQWAAVHLRLESDRAGHGSEAAKAGVGTLNKIKQQLAQHFNNNPNVPALYASGALEENIKREIPASWRNKNDYFDAANWAGMWRGTWFDGRAYDITNATGSLVDMFVLLEAPLTIMAEFSSFGEYVAALRCAWERPTIMYGTSGDFFKVDCSKQLLFMRAWHTENRKLGCPGATVSTHACANHFKGHQAFKMNVLKLDGAIRDYSESMLQTVPR